jgi:cyclopropane fatty-acyl-phospholipid synthase-like methyltransferase
LFPAIDPATITDDVYRAKFIDLPNIINDWVSPYFSLAGANVLDFGCGEATTALGLALRMHVGRVVGIDIGPELTQCGALAKRELGLESLPENLTLLQIDAGSMHDDSEQFDLIYSWSVFEHVRQDLTLHTLRMLRRHVRPEGLLFIQVSPLFYSSEGSHLITKVPERWGHLYYQDSEYMRMLSEAITDQQELEGYTSTYRTLNRMTAPRLAREVQEAGFEILRDYRTYDEYPIPPEVEAVYQTDALRTQQIVLLARPITASAPDNG